MQATTTVFAHPSSPHSSLSFAHASHSHSLRVLCTALSLQLSHKICTKNLSTWLLVLGPARKK
jgi:hypothetical protein